MAADFTAREELTEEWITIPGQLWTAGSPTEFEGRHHGFAPLPLLPRPDRPIPIVIGGNSRSALRRALTSAMAGTGCGWLQSRSMGPVGRLQADLPTPVATPLGFVWCCAPP